MSLKIFALVLAITIGVSHALPAFDTDDVESFDPFRPARPDRFPPTGPIGGWDFFSLPDFSAIQAYINSVRQSIAASFAGAGEGFDLGKGNTTSETKIIDGNRVTINRTEYNENGVHVVVKNVEVQPVGDSGEATVPNTSTGSTGSTGSTPAIANNVTSAETTQSPSREDLETFGDIANEQPSKRESGSVYDNLETFDDIDFIPHNNLNNPDIETMDEFPERDLTNDINVNKMAEKQYNEDVEEFDVNLMNNIPKRYPQQQKYQYHPTKNTQPKEQNVNEDVEEVFHDLSGDTYVNDLLARKLQGRENADWEHYQRQPLPYQDYQVYPQDVTRYHDLSRDTYVNELAARRGMPRNPDAEELDVDFLRPAAFGNNENNALRKRHS